VRQGLFPGSVLHTAQAAAVQGVRTVRQFADIWVDAAQALLPPTVPRETAR
jgi:hypothetical protein